MEDHYYLEKMLSIEKEKLRVLTAFTKSMTDSLEDMTVSLADIRQLLQSTVYPCAPEE